MGGNSKNDTYSRGGYRRRAEWFKEVRREKIGDYPALVQGGPHTHQLEMEVQNNFVNGQFLSAIITAASVIEQMLVSQIVFLDRSQRKENLTLGDALNLASAEYDLISPDITDSFDTLYDISEVRNTVVHFRESHEDRIFQAQIEQFDDLHPNKHGKEFSEKVIRAMFDIKTKCYENEMGVFDGEGPLTQGIKTHKHGGNFPARNVTHHYRIESYIIPRYGMALKYKERL